MSTICSPTNYYNFQIEAYFAQIPVQKVPKLASAGEKFRAQQLSKQIPRQDLALAYCKFIDDEYKTVFQEFVDTRNICALDIGYVRPANENNSVSLQFNQNKFC